MITKRYLLIVLITISNVAVPTIQISISQALHKKIRDLEAKFGNISDEYTRNLENVLEHSLRELLNIRNSNSNHYAKTSSVMTFIGNNPNNVLAQPSKVKKVFVITGSETQPNLSYGDFSANRNEKGMNLRFTREAANKQSPKENADESVNKKEHKTDEHGEEVATQKKKKKRKEGSLDSIEFIDNGKTLLKIVDGKLKKAQLSTGILTTEQQENMLQTDPKELMEVMRKFVDELLRAEESPRLRVSFRSAELDPASESELDPAAEPDPASAPEVDPASVPEAPEPKAQNKNGKPKEKPGFFGKIIASIKGFFKKIINFIKGIFSPKKNKTTIKG